MEGQPLCHIFSWIREPWWVGERPGQGEAGLHPPAASCGVWLGLRGPHICWPQRQSTLQGRAWLWVSQASSPGLI